MHFNPSMPNLKDKVPKEKFTAIGSDLVAFLYENVAPWVGEEMINHRYVLSVADRKAEDIVLFVTLECSQFTKDMSFLCTFDRNGAHSNHGPLSDVGHFSLAAAFEQKALNLASELLKVGPFVHDS